MTRFVFQLHFDSNRRLGPGKIDLLRQIDATGSISAAGRAMNMSYRRAWLLVDDMNTAFGAPVVATRLGGASEGRAKLTELGHELVRLYGDIAKAAAEAAAGPLQRLTALAAASATPPHATPATQE